MKRIVILNPKIKDDFEEIIKGMGESVEAGQDRIAIMEKYIIDALNTYNHKLKINYVKYLDCKTIIEYLPEFKLRYNQGKYHGLIIEEDEIESNYKDNGWSIDLKYGVKRRIVCYLYLTPIEEQSRNTIVSQTIFPELCDYIEKYIDSPSYTFSNHKEYFLNIIPESVGAASILSEIAFWEAIGIEYIDVFGMTPLESKIIPGNLKNSLKKILEEDEKNKVVVNNDYKCKYYDLNFENKTLKLKADSIKKAIKWDEKNNTYTIYGSQEKFFWTKALPITQIAFDLGYKIDFSDYEKFVDYYLPYSSSRERKGKRCKVVLDYLKKYCKYD